MYFFSLVFEYWECHIFHWGVRLRPQPAFRQPFGTRSQGFGHRLTRRLPNPNRRERSISLMVTGGSAPSPFFSVTSQASALPGSYRGVGGGVGGILGIQSGSGFWQGVGVGAGGGGWFFSGSDHCGIL